MTCGKCFTPNPDGSKFCQACGNPLSVGVAAPGPMPLSASAPANPKATISLVLGLCSLACSCLTGIPAIVFGILALQKPGGRTRAAVGISLGVLSMVFWGGYFVRQAAALRKPAGQHIITTGVSGADDPQAAEEKQPASTAEAAPLQVPDDEKNFCRIVAASMREGAAAKKAGANEAKRAKLRAARRVEFEKALGQGSIRHWLGTVAETGITRQGLASVLIKLPCGASVGTWSNALADLGSDSLIPQTSKLFEVAGDLKERQPVVFGGSFVPDGQSADGYKEMSLSDDDALTEPQYLIKFSELAAARSGAAAHPE